MKAKYPGLCRLCGVRILPGDDIAWAPGERPVHAVCPQLEPPPPVPPIPNVPAWVAYLEAQPDLEEGTRALLEAWRKENA